MNKVKILKLNIITSILPWIVLAVIGFVKIKFFINVFGSELNGFIQLITQIYGYLSLVEMGFGSAIIFKLYKPLANGDKSAVVKLFNGSKKIYKKIAIQLSTLGVVAAFIVPFFIQVDTLSRTKMIVIFLLFAIDYFTKYIFDLPYRTLLYADQKKYKANLIVNISLIIVKLVEMLLILSEINYLIILPIIIVLNAISYVVFSNIVKKEYPWLGITSEVDMTTREMSKDIMAHKISRIAFYGTDNIIISMTKGLGLMVTSIYGSYNYIVVAIRNIIDLFLAAPMELLGNKFAKEENSKAEKLQLYNEFIAATYFIGILTSAIFFISINKLVEIWINKDYVLDMFTMLMFSMYIWYECIGRTNLTMIEATGKYKETKHIEIISVVVKIILSIILVKKLGIAGVVLSAVISLAFIKQPLQTKYIHNSIFKEKMLKNFIQFIINTLILLVFCLLNTFVVKYFNMYNVMTYVSWLINTLILLVLNGTLIFALMYGLNKNFRGAFKRFVKR